MNNLFSDRVEEVVVVVGEEDYRIYDLYCSCNVIIILMSNLYSIEYRMNYILRR